MTIWQTRKLEFLPDIWLAPMARARNRKFWPFAEVKAQRSKMCSCCALSCMQCASSKHRWEALSQVSIQCRMCVHQMIPKRRRAACGELHTTSVAICNALGSNKRTLFTAAPTGAKWSGGPPRPRLCRLECSPLHARRESATHGCDAKRTPSHGRRETDQVLHCLVRLREPTRRTVAAAASSSAKSTWSSSSGKELSAILGAARSALRAAVTTRYLASNWPLKTPKSRTQISTRQFFTTIWLRKRPPVNGPP